MRFLILPLASLALASGWTAREIEPRPIVILVHGRGHLDSDSAALRREWKRDLDSGLATVGLPPLADSDVRLAWYAGALDASARGRCGSAREVDDDSLDVGMLLNGFVAALAEAVPKTEAPEARALLGDVLYVMDAGRRCAAQRRVGEVIESALKEGRPVVVVAYSLGSLVTYEYLRSRPTNASGQTDIRLITLGSPLGNPDLRELLGSADSLRVPAGVATWDNVFDPDDIFAAPLEGPWSAKRVRDRRALPTDIYGAHDIGRYLHDRETATAVGMALCAAAASDTESACRRLMQAAKN